jgi:hypothetical protein
VGESCPRVFHEFTLTDSSGRTGAGFSGSRQHTIDSIMKFLLERFDQQQSNILKSTKFADFTQWPKEDDGIMDTIYLNMILHK